MSTFSVPVVRIKSIEPIYGSDAIELAVVGDYRSVVKKGDFKAGELAVYIPEQAVLPEPLIEALGLTGRLAGSKKDRVKAIKLRGCLSQGLLYKVDQTDDDRMFVSIPAKDDPIGYMVLVNEGDDVAADFGIEKYVVPVPAHLAGEVYGAGCELTVAYDIENYKKFPDVLKDGEEVVFTEKLHGTFTGFGILPRSHWDPKHFLGRFVVFSKGLGADGLCFKDSEANANNTYVQALMGKDLFNKLGVLMESMEEDVEFNDPLFLLGETFGGSVQKGFGYDRAVPEFRLFDVCVGFRGDQHYFGYEARLRVAEQLGIETVPILYRGPFSKEVLYQYTNGKETLSGKEAHIREGVVVTPVEERRDEETLRGRVILKSVSEAYLLRKDGTEYN